MGSIAQRLVALLIAVALGVMLRPGELRAASGHTAVSRGEAEDVVLHDPPRPLLVPRCHGVDLDDSRSALDTGAQGMLIDLAEMGSAAVAAIVDGARVSIAERRRCHGRPPTRAPPQG